jgi:putative ABC transport system ATP-binding protein
MPTEPHLLQPNYLPPPDQCSGEPLIAMEQIVKTFSNAAGQFTALKEVTACFYPGEFVSVVGKSGSGKSTLVNMITGIDHPTSGTVRIGGTFVHNLSENDMSIWRGRNLGIVFQFFQLLPTLTLLENVILPMYLAGLYKPAERERRAYELLNLVGLGGLEDKLPAAVSGGQQQSAAIARALANDPPILIADEPTGNLDSRTADEVFAIFSNLIDQGKTILMVTHDISLAKRTTRTLLISDGEIINPWVAGAFSQLNHSQMLWLSHHLRPHVFAPGAVIAGPGAPLHGLLLITQGEVEIVANGHPGSEQVVARLGADTYLSSLEMKDDGLQHTLVRSVNAEPLEVYSLDLNSFQGWLASDPKLQIKLEQAALRRTTAWRVHPDRLQAKVER